ncbi:MAG: plasmid pRiA4b ORF-3 family protein [Desulfovibrio sp.]|nr:plasmid pRiA4b ORF-3 family protein [Desulfovibrio sp.]
MPYVYVGRANKTESTCYKLAVHLLEGRGCDFYHKNVIRIIEILPSNTLYELHLCLFQAFNRFDGHLYEFYVNSEDFFCQDGEHYGPASPADGDRPAVISDKQTKIQDLGLRKGDCILYMFDTGDDWRHRIIVLDTNVPAQKSTRYPRVCKKIGRCPPQYAEEY